MLPLYDPARARRTLETMLDDPMLDDPIRNDRAPELRYLLWEACIAGGDRAAGLAWLDAAIALDPVRRHAPAVPGTPLRHVTALAVPGDFQANAPLAFLFDATTALSTLFITDPGAEPRLAASRLPHADALFVAIAEDEAHAAALASADRIAAASGLPVVNSGAGIAAMSRTGASARLAGIDGAIVPQHVRLGRGALAAAPPSCPFILRPLGAHAGNGLVRIQSRAELDSCLASSESAIFHVAPFVDFADADGLYRKCRIVFVDGVPLPLHLAIHDDWAVWYYNAHMDAHPDRALEETRFLDDMEGAIGPFAMRALHAIAAAVGLDYFGLDAGLLADGRLLIFEIETGMIVHDPGPDPRHASRRAAFLRIRRAVERMIDRRVRLGAAGQRSVAPTL